MHIPITANSLLPESEGCSGHSHAFVWPYPERARSMKLLAVRGTRSR